MYLHALYLILTVQLLCHLFNSLLSAADTLCMLRMPGMLGICCTPHGNPMLHQSVVCVESLRHWQAIPELKPLALHIA